MSKPNSQSEMGEKSGFSPWLFILLTAPIPLVIFGLFFYKWYQQSTDYSRITSDFIRRQNSIIAYDSIEVSRRFSGLLERFVSDLRTLALVPPSVSAYESFYGSHELITTVANPELSSIRSQVRPLYNEIAVLSLKGDYQIQVSDGRGVPNARPFKDCTSKVFCDRGLITSLKKSRENEILFGELFRWYSAEGEVEDLQGATLRIGMRLKNSILLLGLDYRHIKEFAYFPTFPYLEKIDLLMSYAQGNYIYIVESRTSDFILHPRYWHVTGIDRKTGERRRPAVSDSDLGTYPLNVLAYQGTSLKDYFDRLLNTSFRQSAVDIFRAPNLVGTIRVLSVAPIQFSKAQYTSKRIFGHVVSGLNVDYFEEPEEKFTPYY